VHLVTRRWLLTATHAAALTKLARAPAWWWAEFCEWLEVSWAEQSWAAVLSLAARFVYSALCCVRRRPSVHRSSTLAAGDYRQLSRPLIRLLMHVNGCDARLPIRDCVTLWRLTGLLNCDSTALVLQLRGPVPFLYRLIGTVGRFRPIQGGPKSKPLSSIIMKSY